MSIVFADTTRYASDTTERMPYRDRFGSGRVAATRRVDGR